MPKERNIMRRFRITELSAVDKPAQAPAKMTIIKREDGMADDILKGEDIHKSIVKRWLDPQDGAQPFTAFLESSIDAKTYWEATDKVYTEIHAVNESMRSIIGDKNLTAADKEAAIRNTVEEFLAAIRAKMPEVEEALTKVLTEEDTVEKGTEMAEREKVTVDGLLKTIEELNGKVDALTKASEGDTADLAKKVEELTKANETLQAEADARKAEDEAISKMTAEEKEAMEDMEDEDKKKFLAASKEDRQKMVGDRKKAKKAEEDAAKAADEVIKVDGAEIKKSDVGDAQFAMFKAMATKNEALAKKAEEQAEEIAKAAFEKKAEAYYPTLPGETVAKGAVLKAVADLPEDVQKTLDSMLKAGEKAVKAGFESLGHKGELDKKATTDFNKRVDEIAARDKIGKTKAMQKAQKEYPEEFKAYQESGFTAH